MPGPGNNGTRQSIEAELEYWRDRAIELGGECREWRTLAKEAEELACALQKEIIRLQEQSA